MAFVAVDKDGRGYIYEAKPERLDSIFNEAENSCVSISKGVVRRLIGRDMDWYDEPVEVK